MRVLVVTNRWDLIGGSERYAREVVQGLRERGHEVQVLAQSAGDANADAADDNGDSPILCANLDRGRLSHGESERVRQAGNRADCSLVLSRVSKSSLALLLQGPPLVRFVQDHTLFCPGLNKMRADQSACVEPLGFACLKHYWLGDGCSGQQVDGSPALLRPLKSLNRAWSELHALRGAKRLLVASHYMAGELQRAGVRENAIEVLPYFTRSGPNDAGAETLPHAIRAFWSDPGTFRLFTPARLVLPDKGIDYLLTVLGKLPERAKLVVAGEGPARSWLERKSRAEGLADRVLFNGWSSAQAIEALYAACDLVAFPSIWNEPFGLVGIEAMAHAKPVVAFDVGGVREWLVPNETGRLATVRDVQALAQAIGALMDDEEERERLGINGRRRVRAKFTPEVHLARLAELLLSLG